MANEINRREFMTTTAAAGMPGGDAAARRRADRRSSSRAAHARWSSRRPTATASRTAARRPCVETAFEKMMTGNDVLDALIAGVNIVELDPLDDSVGYGGLPNADGVVQLDSCCMHGPTKRAGGVGAHRGRQDAVARGQGGDGERPTITCSSARTRQTFARNLGLRDLRRPEHARTRARKWLEWKQRDRSAALHQGSRGARAAAIAPGHDRAWSPTGSINENHIYGTINCDGVNAQRRGLRRDDDERAGVEDSGPPRRFADSRRRALRGRRRRRGRLDRPRRGQPLQPLRRSSIVEEMRRGAHPEGRRDGGAQAHQGATRSRSGC